MINRRIINHPEVQFFHLLQSKETIKIYICFFMLEPCAEYNSRALQAVSGQSHLLWSYFLCS